MDDKVLIAKRVALELKEGDLVNLGIGLPTLVAKYLPAGMEVYFQAENGFVGTSPLPEQGMEDEFLTDAGGNPVGAIPGAVSLDSSLSFGLIRGGHLDVTVLGGLEVDEQGHLANWIVPGKLIPGMGGAMDLVTGAKRVIVAMTHTAKGAPKIVKKCSLPLTSVRRVSLIVTELAVIEPTAEGLVLREVAPGLTAKQVVDATGAKLIIPERVPVMPIKEEAATAIAA
jgi:acetate CoA/acetoacetate CoA-transferase beta subunit